jgi:Anti-anti-sigma regulatory factor (antagonist of anti-sigma factor)
MELVDEQIEEGVKRIRLTGRLDMKGTQDVDLHFTTLTSTTPVKVAVDMSGVDFVASIGMRLLLSCAKANAARGGKLALYGLQPMVRETLDTAGIIALIPVLDDEPAALAIFAG